MPVLNAFSSHRLDFALDQKNTTEKQHQAMNQAFLHDILNTAGGIKGVAEMLLEKKSEDDEELRILVMKLADQLLEEITSQRDLMAAESGNMEVNERTVSSRRLLMNLAARYQKLPVAAGCRIDLCPDAEDARLVTDPRLLERVLGNMLINALEAESKGGAVAIGCSRKPGGVHFWVRNPGYIPPGIQARIFDFSFSTKGRNRGLGTYSMLLLTERFLKGSIAFSTDPDRGTVFHLTLPGSAP